MAAVILAAGAGSRMGRTKQLLPFGDTTLLGQVIETARDSGLEDIVVVLGHAADRIRDTLDFSGTRVVVNHRWQTGQAASLAAGVSALAPSVSGALFLLGDQPLVAPATLRRLVSAFQTTDHWIVVPCIDDRRGNPVLVARPLFGRLAALSGDTGARVLFDEFRDRTLRVQVTDPGILLDADTPDAYAALIQTRGTR